MTALPLRQCLLTGLLALPLCLSALHPLLHGHGPSHCHEAATAAGCCQHSGPMLAPGAPDHLEHDCDICRLYAGQAVLARLAPALLPRHLLDTTGQIGDARLLARPFAHPGAPRGPPRLPA